MTDIEKILITLKLIPHVSAFAQVIVLAGRNYGVAQIPNDLNAIRELELLVIEKVGADAYGDAFTDFVDFYDDMTTYEWYAKIATADAQTRIAAMLAALEGK